MYFTNEKCRKINVLRHFITLYSLLIYTRERYSPVRVSILITSSCSTNKGTYTVAPVSTTAGFVAPVAVSPLNPGSVSVIFNSTKQKFDSRVVFSTFYRQ